MGVALDRFSLRFALTATEREYQAAWTHAMLRPIRIGYAIGCVALQSSAERNGSGNSLWTVNRNGGENGPVVTESAPVTFVANTYAKTGSSTIVFYGTDYMVTSYRGSYILGGSAPSGHHITSIGWDGTREQWTECDSANTHCTVGYRSANDFLPYSVAVNDGARNIMGDATQLYYVTNTEFIRGVY